MGFTKLIKKTLQEHVSNIVQLSNLYSLTSGAGLPVHENYPPTFVITRKKGTRMTPQIISGEEYLKRLRKERQRGRN